MATNETPNNSAAEAQPTAGEVTGVESKETKSASANEETHAADETLEASDASNDSEDSCDESESEESKLEDVKAKKTNGVQKKINKLTKRAADERREKEYWREVALKAQQVKPGEQDQRQEPVVQSDDEPNPDEFETVAAYTKALAKWTYAQEKKADESRQRESKIKEDHAKTVESFQSKARDFAKTHSDFKELIDDAEDIRMSPGLQELLYTSDVGVEALYELVKNRDEYERINALPYSQAAREIYKLENQIAQKKESSKQTKKQSSAPVPITPVAGMQGGGVKKSVYDESNSFSEYVKLRREQEQKRRAR